MKQLLTIDLTCLSKTCFPWIIHVSPQIMWEVRQLIIKHLHIWRSWKFSTMKIIQSITVIHSRAGMRKFGPWGVLWSLFKVLPVKIWSWNLAHRSRTLNEAFGIFFGSGSFLVASEWGFKETLWSLGSERLGRDGKLKFCRELPWSNSGPRNFIQLNRSIGCTLISIFLGQVQKSQSFLIRLLTMFHKFQENFKRKLKWSNWVFIEFYIIWHLR